MPCYINAIDEAILRYIVNDTTKSFAIRITNYPFPQPNSFIFDVNGQIYFGFIFLIAFAILPAGAAVFIVQVTFLFARVFFSYSIAIYRKEQSMLNTCNMQMERESLSIGYLHCYGI